MGIPSDSLVALWVLCLALTAGCSQEQGGDTSTNSATLASVSAPCGDLTAEAILAKVLPEYKTTLPLPSPTTLTIRVAYKGGEIICHPARPAPPGSAAPDFPERMEIEVAVVFATDDSSFSESFTAKLMSGGGSATLSYSIEASALRGRYDPRLDGYEDVKISFSAIFSGKDTWGTLSKSGQRPGMASEYIPVARWDNRER